MVRSPGNNSLRRRLQILDVVRQQGDVKVEALSQQFGVSTVTIRSDLSYLEEQGFILRTFGRAMYNPSFQGQQPVIGGRGDDRPIHKAEEIQVARLAAEIVEDGDTLMLGAGSLVHKMVPFLAERVGLSVIVNDLEIVPSLRQFLDCEIHLLGGTLIEDCSALVGPMAEQTVRLQAINKCFMECKRLNTDIMLMYNNAAMARLYRSIVDHAQFSVALTARFEFPVKEGYPVCGLAEFNRLIVNRELDERELEVIHRAGFSEKRAADRFLLFART